MNNIILSKITNLETDSNKMSLRRRIRTSFLSFKTNTDSAPYRSHTKFGIVFFTHHMSRLNGWRTVNKFIYVSITKQPITAVAHHELWNATIQTVFNRFNRIWQPMLDFIRMYVWRLYVYKETHTHTLIGCAQTIVRKP